MGWTVVLRLGEEASGVRRLAVGVDVRGKKGFTDWKRDLWVEVITEDGYSCAPPSARHSNVCTNNQPQWRDEKYRVMQAPQQDVVSKNARSNAHANLDQTI